MKRILFFLTIATILWASCAKKANNNFPIEPQIYYKSVDPNIIDFNDTTSAVNITFTFNDGDGDLGTDQTNTQQQIFLKDSRDTTSGDSTFGYPFPYVDPSMRPKNGSLQGNVVVRLGRQYFSVIDSLHIALRKDTLHYKMYVIDDSGHKSNVIETDPIYIQF